jgi:hypothetical protein
MEVVVRVLAFVGGAVVALGILSSALRTVVVPRAEPSLITRSVFVTVRGWFTLRVKRVKSWDDADSIMARYPAVALMVLPAVWIAGVILAFTPMFWALGSDFPREAFTRAGSSLLTLGFAFARDLPETILSFVGATIGLGLVALLISYLPSIYAQFSQREQLVGQLDVRAGSPPSAAAMLVRAVRIEWLDELDGLWAEWDRWFVSLEESHSSNTALPFFRSQHPTRSWITAAGCVLDSASLRVAIFDLPRSFQAELCIRSGFLALRHIADAFSIDFDPDPQPGNPISVNRSEFDELWDTLAAEGAPLVADRDAAWHAFAGWRVNYDSVLLQICALVVAPPAPWSADRSLTTSHQPMGRRRR